MTKQINKLITIKQLPIIEQMLDEMSGEIDKKIEFALRIVPENSDKVLSETKKIRAALNKDLSELETARKKVKAEIMNPYLEFESIYKTKISDKFKQADTILKNKIDACETNIKDNRKKDLKEFFDEYCRAQKVDGVCFENMGLKINISGSNKSYRDKIKEWIDKVKKDLEIIETSKDKYELLIDYKFNRNFDLQQALLDHEKREREIERLKNIKETTPEELSAPETNDDTEIFELDFVVRGTKKQLKALKEYLIQNKLL